MSKKWCSIAALISLALALLYYAKITLLAIQFHNVNYIAGGGFSVEWKGFPIERIPLLVILAVLSASLVLLIIFINNRKKACIISSAVLLIISIISLSFNDIDTAEYIFWYYDFGIDITVIPYEIVKYILFSIPLLFEIIDLYVNRKEKSRVADASLIINQ